MHRWLIVLSTVLVAARRTAVAFGPRAARR